MPVLRNLRPIILAAAILAAAGFDRGHAAEQGKHGGPTAVLSFVEAGRAGVGESGIVATALGLRAQGLSAADAADVLVLIDTSASQTGAYRRRQLEALDSLLAASRPADGVRIAAADVACEPLADSFEAATSDAVKASLRSLDARTPLGSTDLAAALETAAGLLAESPRAKAVVYIGDGPGFSGVEAQEFARGLDLLRSRRRRPAARPCHGHVHLPQPQRVRAALRR